MIKVKSHAESCMSADRFISASQIGFEDPETIRRGEQGDETMIKV
jgi:hypothetical protein